MGKVAKIALPLAGLATLAFVTGGFGLAGAGAAAGAGGGAAGAAGAAAGAGAAAAGTGAALTTPAAIAAGDVLAGAAASTATAAAAVGAPAAGSAGLWSSFLAATGLTGKEALGLGLSAAGAGASAMSGSAQADALEGQNRLRMAEDARAIEEAERDSQYELRALLAQQNAVAAAEGADTSTGSALQVAEGASTAADRSAASLAARRSAERQAGYLSMLSARRKRTAAVGGGLLSFGGDVADVLRA